ncbi:hypothetical protein AB5I41_26220 [Sphingomonas sp. MMS24-JH45]
MPRHLARSVFPTSCGVPNGAWHPVRRPRRLPRRRLQLPRRKSSTGMWTSDRPSRPRVPMVAAAFSRARWDGRSARSRCSRGSPSRCCRSSPGSCRGCAISWL